MVHLRKVSVVLHINSCCSPTPHTNALNSLEGDSVTDLSPITPVNMVFQRTVVYMHVPEHAHESKHCNCILAIYILALTLKTFTPT